MLYRYGPGDHGIAAITGQKHNSANAIDNFQKIARNPVNCGDDVTQ